MSSRAFPHPISLLPAFDEKDDQLLNVIIETPKGSRNKFDFDEKRGIFLLGGVMPAGAAFPFDFGFIPGTIGDDGDPLDIVVLSDEGACAVPGCLVTVRLLGAIEAQQNAKDEEPERNDRLIGVTAKSRQFHEFQTLQDISGEIVADIECFFRWYNEAKGGEFKPTARCGPERARELIAEGMQKKKRE